MGAKQKKKPNHAGMHAAPPVPTAEKEPPVSTNKKPDKLAGALSWAKSIAIAFVMWLFLRALLIEAYHITSGSMENTLLVGDVLFVNKALYGAELPIIGTKLPAIRDPRRSDIVIFESVEERGLTVVKRVIGMPGDTLAMKGNVLLVNGVEVDEPYVIRADTLDYSDPKMMWQAARLVGDVDRSQYHPSLKNWGPIVVPADSFLVLGDNRDASYDGRYWGFLGRDRVHGRAEIIYYSHDKNGILPLPFLTAIRWRRLFSLIR